MATETQNTHGTTVINDRDAIFCTHFKEVVRSDSHNCKMSLEYFFNCLQCTDCNFDGREENDSFFGVGSSII